MVVEVVDPPVEVANVLVGVGALLVVPRKASLLALPTAIKKHVALFLSAEHVRI